MIVKTMWSERDLAHEYFYLALPFIVSALEILNSINAEMRSFEKEYTKRWDYKTTREATSLLSSVTSLEFIFSLIRLYRLLHPLTGITNRLQGRSVVIIEAYDDVPSVIKDIKSTRKNIDKEFSLILNKLNK